MEANAIAKHVRMSPSKIRPVADAIRGKKIEKAYITLRNLNKRAAEFLLKTVNSAVANLQDQDPVARLDEMIIKEIRIDEGTTLKRWQPRAMGRATPIRKRSSHISVVVSTEETEAD